MLSDLWTNMSHYFVGVIIFLALLFALMDSSRKYDKYRGWPYLTLAIGYFLLAIWALLRATIINSNLIDPLLSSLQLGGLVFLVIGYFSEHHHEKTHNHEISLSGTAHPTPEIAETPILTEPKKASTSWIEMLSATSDDQEPKEEVQLDAISSSKTTQPNKDQIIETPVEQSSPGTATDESHIEPLVGNHKTATPKPRKTKKKFVAGEPVDLSYLAARKKGAKTTALKSPVPAKKTAEEPATELSRDKLMDDLFPINNSAAKRTKSTKKALAQPVNGTLPGEHREKLNAIALSFASLTTDHLMVNWQQTAVIVLLLILALETIRRIKSRGNILLTVGFFLLLISTISQFMITSTGSALIPLLQLALEAIGFICLGFAGWQRITGKITHHFLSVISTIYLIILILTAILARFIATDSMSLQLLLLLCTGTLIAMLPITHSLTYNHPAQTKLIEEPHD